MRLVFEHGNEYDLQWAAIRSAVEKIGCAFYLFICAHRT